MNNDLITMQHCSQLMGHLFTSDVNTAWAALMGLGEQWWVMTYVTGVDIYILYIHILSLLTGLISGQFYCR
jgi:hypothetical protein